MTDSKISSLVTTSKSFDSDAKLIDVFKLNKKRISSDKSAT